MPDSELIRSMKVVLDHAARIGVDNLELCFCCCKICRCNSFSFLFRH